MARLRGYGGFGIYGADVSRILELNRRYEASRALSRNGVEIIAIGDPAGSRLDRAVQRLLREATDGSVAFWEDLVSAAKALRWRRLTQPQPLHLNRSVHECAEQLALEAGRLRGAIGNEALLDELRASARAVSESDSPVGDILLRSILELGQGECAVVAASKPAQAGLTAWLRDLGVRVLTAGELDRELPTYCQQYVIGPPRFFKSSITTAPVVSDVSFLMPTWFGDRSLSRSALAPFAEWALRVEARVVVEGDVSQPDVGVTEPVVENDYLPQPVWEKWTAPDREPTSNEVEARRVILSGGFATWLDDGDRIRALDPRQPAGERVVYTEVTAVRVGTYLLLREGETERGALHQAGLSLLGSHATLVDLTQQTWKRALSIRLMEFGYRQVVGQLRANGVAAADRARAWAEPTLIRPHSDRDFERLLGWLDIQVQPTFGNATRLRKMVYQASADIRDRLETAVSDSDLSVLERDGRMSLNLEMDGFRGILTTRVLAISPHMEIVPRHDARVLFKDRRGKWLE